MTDALRPPEGEVSYLYQFDQDREEHVITFRAHSGAYIQMVAPDTAEGWGDLNILIGNFPTMILDMQDQFGDFALMWYGASLEDLADYLQ